MSTKIERYGFFVRDCFCCVDEKGNDIAVLSFSFGLHNAGVEFASAFDASNGR